MPGLPSAIRQERLKKTGGRLASPGLFTINEEDEQQRNGGCRKTKGSETQPKADEKISLAPHRPASGHSPTSTNKNETLLVKVDERQRLARERREQREKQLAARESALLEREERAKQYYEKHLEERKKKLEEQRLKEERRRAAVEEKRRQKLEEEKERHEAVVRRTIERSQKAKQKPNRWSWGGPLQSSLSYSSDADRRSVSTVNLSKHVDPVINKRLSSSSATLLNSSDRALQKRISAYDRLHLHPPSRVKSSQDLRQNVSRGYKSRRLQLTPWESNIVSRLLTPTHSYLARSKSAASLSGESVIPICPRSASCSPLTSASFKPTRYRSSERPKVISSNYELSGHRRSGPSLSVNKNDKENEKERKSLSSLTGRSAVKRSQSPGVKSRAKSSSPVRRTTPHKATRSANPRQIKSPAKSAEDSPSHSRPISPGNIRPGRTEPIMGHDDEEEDDQTPDDLQLSREPKQELRSLPVEGTSKSEFAEGGGGESTPAVSQSATSTSSLVHPGVVGKPSAGTTDPEEATRLLAEKRRQAREQREREEQERREKEEAERNRREELQRIKVDANANEMGEEPWQREEIKRTEAEEKMNEERQRQLEEDRQRQKEEEEEMAKLQKQKEEEEARHRQEAERLRQERERHFLKEEQERLERKKRLEEIMKRTRKPETGEKKPVTQRNGEITQQSKAEVTEAKSAFVSEHRQNEESTQQASGSGLHGLPDVSGQVVAAGESDNSKTENQPKENGIPMEDDQFEEVISLSAEVKPSKLDVAREGDGNVGTIIPVIAFTENGSLGTLTNVDGVQSPQTTEVI
ncbi:ensconsin isoform X2 [Polypterus senegalus]|uniref:ensconsin isoform X2 n=1 Tax=Polypterus senegalus TaxID=55291 RepID=UPI00196459D9|nr:ensconsin isoform X2 [Polypterus senegalus]